MAVTLPLSELAKMSPEKRDEALDRLVTAAKAPRNGQAKILDQRIRAFEMQYEMTSEEMLQRFADGSVKDTADVSRWQMLLFARDRGR